MSKDLMGGVLGVGIFWVGREWTYLQLGQDGEDLESMTKRWQFRHAKATILLLEELF